VELIVGDTSGIQDLLACHEIAVPHVAASDKIQPTVVALVQDALEQGDVAVLIPGTSVSPPGPSQTIIRFALERGFPVTPVPGPSLPLTALIVSGLPADSFLYLGSLPQEPNARRRLLATVATERRTLVALGSPGNQLGLLSELHAALGDRPLAVVASGQQIEDTWRGTIAGALAHLSHLPVGDPCALVIGGSWEKAALWGEDHLRAEIHSCLDQGLGAKETSRRLAAESRWPRREIYRLAVEIGRLHASE
jgi:16S rRNA (cytidine1402-2'-O)-methyltransferase